MANRPAANPPAPHAAEDPGRRRFLLSLGWGGIALLCASATPGMVRFLWPRAEGGGLDQVEAGAPVDYRGAIVSTRWIGRYGLWLVHLDGRLFALEARCTHLGCTPRWTPESGCFVCPCHGSRFSTEGAPLNGPATLPLQRLAVRIEGGQVIVDRSVRATMEVAEQDARFFVRI